MKLHPIERFDVTAEAFRRMTGMMAPGKDESALAGGEHTIDERSAAFTEWIRQHGDCLRAVLAAVESICQRDGDE